MASWHPANELMCMLGWRALRSPAAGTTRRHCASLVGRPRRAKRLVARFVAGRHALRTGAAAEAESHFGRVLELWSVVDDAETLAGLDHPALLAEASEAAKPRQHFWSRQSTWGCERRPSSLGSTP